MPISVAPLKKLKASIASPPAWHREIVDNKKRWNAEDLSNDALNKTEAKGQATQPHYDYMYCIIYMYIYIIEGHLR